jgi:hypothetical protein
MKVYIFIVLTLWFSSLISSSNPVDLISKKYLVKARELSDRTNEIGTQNDSLTTIDEGDGNGQKIRDTTYQNQILKDRWLKLQGGNYVCGSHNQLINVYECTGICDDFSPAQVTSTRKVKICKFDPKHRRTNVRSMDIAGKCGCQSIEFIWKKKLNAQFYSPYGTFVLNLNVAQDSTAQLNSNNFNTKGGDMFGDGDVGQKSTSNFEMNGEYIPKYPKIIPRLNFN